MRTSRGAARRCWSSIVKSPDPHKATLKDSFPFMMLVGGTISGGYLGDASFDGLSYLTAVGGGCSAWFAATAPTRIPLLMLQVRAASSIGGSIAWVVARGGAGAGANGAFNMSKFLLAHGSAAMSGYILSGCSVSQLMDQGPIAAIGLSLSFLMFSVSPFLLVGMVFIPKLLCFGAAGGLVAGAVCGLQLQRRVASSIGGVSLDVAFAGLRGGTPLDMHLARLRPQFSRALRLAPFVTVGVFANPWLRDRIGLFDFMDFEHGATQKWQYASTSNSKFTEVRPEDVSTSRYKVHRNPA